MLVVSYDYRMGLKHHQYAWTYINILLCIQCPWVVGSSNASKSSYPSEQRSELNTVFAPVSPDLTQKTMFLTQHTEVSPHEGLNHPTKPVRSAVPEVRSEGVDEAASSSPDFDVGQASEARADSPQQTASPDELGAPNTLDRGSSEDRKSGPGHPGNLTTAPTSQGGTAEGPELGVLTIVLVELAVSAIFTMIFMSFHVVEVFLVCLGVFVVAVLGMSCCVFLRKHHTVSQLYKVPVKRTPEGPPAYEDLHPGPVQLQPIQMRAQHPPPLPPDPVLPPSPAAALACPYAEGDSNSCLYQEGTTHMPDRTMSRFGNHMYEQLGVLTASTRGQTATGTVDYLECLGPAPPPPVDLIRLSSLPPPSASMLDLTGESGQ